MYLRTTRRQNRDGAEVVYYQLAHIGIGPTLRQVLMPSQDAPRFERAPLAMTAHRLCDPQSKLGVWERPSRDGLFSPGAEQLTKDDLYAAMDTLHAQATAIEQAVFFHTADLFKLDVDLLFYDTTTCIFAIDEDDEDELRRFGRPKDGAWAPQVVVALAVTREGLPVRSWVLPGNTPDATTVERYPRTRLTQLEARPCPHRSPMPACTPRRTARRLPAAWASRCWRCRWAPSPRLRPRCSAVRGATATSRTTCSAQRGGHGRCRAASV